MQISIKESIPLRMRFRFETLNKPRDRESLVETLVSAAAFFLPLVAYVLTLAPTFYSLDSAELTIAAHTGGLMRATGYPLYLLLGRAWSWIPIGDIGFRMNLFSAVCGALGVWLAYRIMRRIGVGRLAAAGAAGLMAAAPYYWSLSLVAEVYTLHVVLMAGLILLLLRWAEDPTSRRLAVAAGWTGLSLSHHLATALLVPGIVFFVLSRGGKSVMRPKVLAVTVVATLAGLSIYMYLPFLYAGDPAFNYAGLYDAALHFQPVDLQSLSGMWWLVSGQTFASRMFAYSGASFWREVLEFGIHLGRAFLYIGILPGLIGVRVLARRDRRLAGMLVLMFAASALFFIDYAVIDKETMFLPTYLVWAVFGGLGYQALADRFADRGPIWAGRLVPAAVLGAVLIATGVTGPQVDLSGDRTVRLRAAAALETVGPDAVIFGWWETVPPIQYLQIIEGRRPDVRIVNRFLITRESIESFVRREAGSLPVYIDRFPEEWVGIYRAVPFGDLYRVEPLSEKETALELQIFQR
jgi:hypothetical protein